MNILNRWLYAFLFAGLVLTGCQKDDPEPEPEPEQAPKLTQKVNTFVKDAMDEVYLWYKQMPSIDIRYEFDTKEYFDKLLYKEDKWSFITDNAAELLSSYEGTEKTFGYALAWGSFWDTQGPTGEYFAIVEYVYPESPAAKAGIQRGDIFISVNGQKIKETNYMNLISGETITLTKGILTEQGIAPGSDLSLTSVVMNLDPVLIKKIIDYEGHKIGYLFYAHYIPNFNSSLDAAFQYFKSNQITDLVLDLRYNPGGEISAAQYLCSSIAPVSVVNNQSTLITKQWNDKYQAYFVSTNATSQLKTTFDPNALVKLGLNKLYVLTTRYTASASELSITGLEPYMNVVQIGDTTSGKYTGAWFLQPEDLYKNASDYESFKNWGIQPIVFRYANSLGVTDFKNGLVPDFYVKDQLLPALPLGDINEPLLRKAVEQISGVPVLALKRAKLPYEFKVLRRASSRFEPMKEVLLDNTLSKAKRPDREP